MKGKVSNPSKQIKHTENSQKELKEAREKLEEQRKQTGFWKGQAQKLKGKMAEER